MIIFFIKAIYIVNWMSLIAAIIVDIIAIYHDDWDDVYNHQEKVVTKHCTTILLYVAYYRQVINRLV